MKPIKHTQDCSFYILLWINQNLISGNQCCPLCVFAAYVSGKRFVGNINGYFNELEFPVTNSQ